MKTRSLAVQGGLAAAALVAAYATWQRGPDTSSEEIIVVDATKSDVQKIRYEDARQWVELERRDEDGESTPWMRTAQKPQPLPDGGTPAASVPEQVRELRGNDLEEKMFERFAPLRASRLLGKLTEDKERELGLSSSPRSLTVTLRSGARPFTLSTGTFGAPYAKDVKDGKVYLLGAEMANELQAASSRLLDRRVHTFKNADVEQAELTAGGRKKTFVQKDDNGVARVVAQGSDKPDDFARNYLDRLSRLVPTDVLGQGEVPPGGAPKVDVRVDYRAHGRPLGFVELGKSGPDVYARSEHTAGWIKLHAGDELFADAKKLVP